MNLNRGEIVLINKSAAEVLMTFTEETDLNDVFGKMNIPKVYHQDVLDFLETCIESEILTNPDSLKKIQRYQVKQMRHISSETLSIVLELSNKCNLSCRHCYNESKPQNNSTLSISSVKKIFSDLQYLDKNLSTLTITGGEPFLYIDLQDVLRLAKSYGFPAIRINSNGTIFPKSIKSLTGNNLSELVSIQVTVLGSTEMTHDKMTRKKGSFSKTINNIARFQDAGLNVAISFIRSKYSENETDEILQLGEKLGVEVITGDLFPLGRAASDFDKIELINTQREMFVVCDSKYYGGEGAGLLSEEKRLSLLENFPPSLPCGKETLAICCNGDVLPCMLLQGIVIGNVFQQSLHEIMNSAMQKKFIKKASIENRHVCSKCELRYACSNKCPAVSLSYGGDFTKKNPFCIYY